jgi:O-antigen/teichoic acid export membrane protein
MARRQPTGTESACKACFSQRMNSRIEISKRLVLVNSASTVLARVINVSVVLWLQQFLLRRVSEEEYVLLPVLMAVILLLPLFTSVLTSGLGRFIVTAYARGDERGITQIVSTMFPLLVVAGLVLLAGGMAFAWYVDRILAIAPAQVRDARLMMALLILAVALRLPCAPFTVGLYVRQKFVLESLLVVGNEMLRLVLLAVLLLGVSTRVLWVVVANVAAELCLIGALVIASRRLVPALRVRVREMQWGRARELLSFGGWNFLGMVAWRLQHTMIPLILNQLATPMDLVVYHVGFLPRRQIDQWTDTMAVPLYPVVTGMHASGAQDRIASVYVRGGRVALWTMLVAATPAIIYAPTVIRLYIGAGYAEAAPVMALTLAGLFLAGGTWLMWQVANATARVRATGLYALVTQLATCGATLYAVKWLGWGGIGAALAGFLVGAAATVLAGWPLGLKLAGVKFGTWVRQTLIPGLTPACLAAPVWLALDLFVQPDSWFGLGLCTAGGALCYLAVLLMLCLEPGDQADLATLLTRIRSFCWGGPMSRAGSRRVVELPLANRVNER